MPNLLSLRPVSSIACHVTLHVALHLPNRLQKKKLPQLAPVRLNGLPMGLCGCLDESHTGAGAETPRDIVPVLLRVAH